MCVRSNWQSNKYVKDFEAAIKGHLICEFVKQLIFQNRNENIARNSTLVYKHFQGRNPSKNFVGKSMSSQICSEIKWPLVYAY